VDGLSFSVRAGEVFGLLGPNGAGKTTTVECIEGLRTSDGGAIHVLGLDVRKDIKQLKQCIGIQLQATNLYHKLTVRGSSSGNKQKNERAAIRQRLFRFVWCGCFFEDKV